MSKLEGSCSFHQILLCKEKHSIICVGNKNILIKAHMSFYKEIKSSIDKTNMSFSLPLSKTKVRKPMSLQLLHVTFDIKLAVEQLEGFFSSTLALLISLSKASPQKSRFTVLKVTTEQFLKACYSQFHPPPLHLDQVLPSGGFLFWLFQTTSNLDRLGTLDTSVMTRKRLSTLS